MKKLTLILALALTACSSGPTVRDTSHDNPKLVNQINRAVHQPVNHSSFAAESKFSPREEFGWATYKMLDKNTNTISLLEVQIIPGAKGRRCVETKITSPTSSHVFRLEMSRVANSKIKTGSGHTVDQKAERLVMWTVGEKTASEAPMAFIGMANKMAGDLAPAMVDTINKESVKRRAQTPAGIFPSCFVAKQDGIFLLRDAEESCYSSRIPAPYIVERESKSERQELLSFGWGARSSFIPSNVKIQVDESLNPTPEKKRTEPKIKIPFLSE